MGTLPERQELSSTEEPGNAIVYAPFHLDRAGGSSILVLWPTCKITIACSRLHFFSGAFCLRAKEVSRNNRGRHRLLASLLGGSPTLKAIDSGVISS